MIGYESRTLNDPFEVSIDKERQKQEGHKTQRVAEGSWDGSKTGAKANFSTSKQKVVRINFICSLSARNQRNTRRTCWNFRVETGEPVLRGSLIKTKWRR
jgi:hypothetical protein